MNDEWDITSADESLQQGDLLLSRDPKTGIVHDVCVVITADCDLAHHKFGKQIACLRITSLRDYLGAHWAERKLRRSLHSETEKILEQLNKWNAERDSHARPLSPDAITTWIKRCEPDEVCQELRIPADARDKLRTTIARFRNAILTLESEEFANYFVRLMEFRAAATGKTRDVCLQEIVKQAQNDTLPDDIFLLPDLPHLPDFGPAVVLLRDLFGLPFCSICLRSSDANSREHFLRLGTLLPTIKYALSQAFGMLYARIGLPEIYEHRKKAAIDKINAFQW
jgi:hypothetical protein